MHSPTLKLDTAAIAASFAALSVPSRRTPIVKHYRPSSTIRNAPRPGRNDPCPNHPEKKFKRCACSRSAA